MKADLHRVRPYGDHLDDGRMQVSFTLPVPAGDEAREAARLYLERLGLQHVEVSHMEAMGEGFTFFVAYAHSQHHLDFTKIHLPKLEFPIVSNEELLRRAREKFHRRIVVVGGTTGSDAHTVGIDAILSIKGIQGDKGLEYYPIFRVVNLRAQVSNEKLVEKAAEVSADAILVSQVVTQQNQHLDNLKTLARFLKSDKRLSPHLLKIVGGPRMDHRTAKSLGFDAGFGPGTKPSQVANYIVHELIRRSGGSSNSPKDRLEGGTSQKARSPGRSLFGWLGGWGKDS